MRTTTIILTVLAASCSILLGCASGTPCVATDAAPSRPTTSAAPACPTRGAQPWCSTLDVPPSPDELIVIEPHTSTICATVAVEGRPLQPRPGLVGQFTEPELTREEKEALCIEPEPINWLEFYVPKPAVNLVSDDLGGPAVNIWGLGGDVSGITFARQGMGVGFQHDPVSGASIQAVRVAESGARKPPVGEVGLGEGGASVGEDRARKVAAHDERCQP